MYLPPTPKSLEPIYESLFHARFYPSASELKHEMLGIVEAESFGQDNIRKWEIDGKLLNASFEINAGQLESVIPQLEASKYVEIEMHDKYGHPTDTFKIQIELEKWNIMGSYITNDICRIETVYRITNLKIQSDGKN